MDSDQPGESRPRKWARIDGYLLGLARRRRSRPHSLNSLRPRTQPENPRLMLSTLPIFGLILALALLAIAIAVVAWPGSERPRAERQEPKAVLGTAPPGWLERSKQDRR
ncbi:MAG TPA: hypothetical protein VM346_07360 [Sphingomicrobium sp.]|nr:hypothetical protein [Sphingomicrobium sp.]